jgi:DNA helicase-2/ATP-dependent DNA helicase PcrA
MEYDTPSRFIKDFDPSLIRVEGEQGSGSGDRRNYGNYGSHGNYTRGLGETTSRGRDWMQNPHPVADRFMADPKPRAVAPRQPETPVDPFSDSFKRTLQAAGGHRVIGGQQSAPIVGHASERAETAHAAPIPTGAAARRFKPVAQAVSAATPNGTAASDSSVSAPGGGDLCEGTVIEHLRFGIGIVVKIEGTGENRKATVNFRNTGTKQLLLKFARYKIVE